MNQLAAVSKTSDAEEFSFTVFASEVKSQIQTFLSAAHPTDKEFIFSSSLVKNKKTLFIWRKNACLKLQTNKNPSSYDYPLKLQPFKKRS